MQIIPDSSTSFRVSWTEIPLSDRNGVIDRYQLSYGTKDRLIADLQLPADTKNHLVTGKRELRIVVNSFLRLFIIDVTSRLVLESVIFIYSVGYQSLMLSSYIRLFW